MMKSLQISPQYLAKGGETIFGDPVQDVDVLGTRDGPATCCPVHDVQAQSIMDSRATCVNEFDGLERGMSAYWRRKL